MKNNERLIDYYHLIKPRVMYGNVLTMIAGFFLASAGSFDVTNFVYVTVGMTFLVSGACALNNYLDRDIDKKMERTQNRPSVNGAIPPTKILLFSIVISIIGLTVLFTKTNALTFILGLIGYVTYVWLYGAWSKRTSIHGTAVGSISGAMPIAAGYAAVTGTIDIGLILVFFILYFWQFPEFFSIAIYRKKEYAAAMIPVLPVVRGVDSAVGQIFAYTILYVISTLALTAFGYTGWIYFIIMLLSGLYWIYLGFLGFGARDKNQWARRMFRFSMIAILLLCFMLSVGPLLP